MRMQRQADGTYVVDGFKFQDAEAACAFIENNPETTQPAAARATGAAAASKRSVWPWVVGVPVGGFVLLLVFGATVGNTPEARAKSQDRLAIELCWKDQGKKSLEPGVQRFIAGACESMEQKFREKYGVAP